MTKDTDESEVKIMDARKNAEKQFDSVIEKHEEDDRLRQFLEIVLPVDLKNLKKLTNTN